MRAGGCEPRAERDRGRQRERVEPARAREIEEHEPEHEAEREGADGAACGEAWGEGRAHAGAPAVRAGRRSRPLRPTPRREPAKAAANHTQPCRLPEAMPLKKAPTLQPIASRAL